MERYETWTVGVGTALLVLALAATAQAGSGRGGDAPRAEVIEVEDDCHPPTFNTEIVPGVVFCDPDFDGDTTASEFFEEIAEDGEVGKWRFHPDDTEIDPGQRLRAVNVGGELHTFTPVDEFGGGCVPDPRLDIGEDPVAECDTFDPANPTAHEFAVAPGERKTVTQQSELQRYMCLIHPWMRSVVEVDHH